MSAKEMEQPKAIALIGPASVGKSSSGEVLAGLIGYSFIDIDQEFENRFGKLVPYMRKYGYPTYCETNSLLTDEILDTSSPRTVFAMPAGYLAHEESPELIQKHKNKIKLLNSVLILPGDSPLESIDLIAERQVARWPETTLEAEKAKYLARHAIYRGLGDIKILGNFSTAETAELIRWGLGSKISDLTHNVES
ncbi:MAG: shikimate kinase [Candidatus Saccharimonadaceae bacterium]